MTTTSESMAFGDLQIDFDPTVLVPRPWTLAQSTWAAELLDDLPAGPVLELCSGAGHIGLAAVLGSGRRLVQVDASEHACGFARRNAARAGVESDVRCGPMDEVVEAGERFALVVADPPWVPSGEVTRFPEDPLWAIDGGDDGLDLARLCLRVAAEHLLTDGLVLLQVGSLEQVRALAPALASLGLVEREAREYPRGALLLAGRG